MRRLYGELDAQGHPLPPARLARRGVVLAGRRAGHRDSLLPRAPAPDAARAPLHARGRGRQRQVADAHPAPRDRPRDRHGLRAASAQGLARGVRQGLAPLSEPLLAAARQPQSRAAPRPLVRAEPPDRGFRRDLRRVAAAALALAQPVRRAGRRSRSSSTSTARCASSTDSAPTNLDRRVVEPLAENHAHAARALPAQAGALRARHARSLRSAAAASVRPPRGAARTVAASGFLREMRPQLARLLVRRARMHPYVVDHVMRTAVQRARVLDLRVQGRTAPRPSARCSSCTSASCWRCCCATGRTTPYEDAAGAGADARDAGAARGHERLHRAADRRVAHRVRRHHLAQGDGPRGARARHGRQPRGAAQRHHRLEARHCLQPARGVPGHRHLRPVRGRVPRADAPAVHRLQPARHDDLARQGAVEADPGLPPHPDGEVRAAAAQPALPGADPPASSRCS